MSLPRAKDLINVYHSWFPFSSSFHWSLSDSKSPQVSKTLLCILAVLYNVVTWMVSTRPPTSKASSHFNKPLVTVPKVPITIGIIIFSSLARSRYLFVLSFLFQFYSEVSRDSKVYSFERSLFLKVWSSGCE